MRIVRTVLLLSAIVLTVPAVIAGTRVRLVHEERLKLSPAAREALVLQDLESILAGPASTTGIATKPYPSVEPGLCKRDVIELSYAKVGSGKNLRYKPEGINSVRVQYQYLGLSGSQSVRDRQKACASLGRTQQAWVSSGDAEHYVSFALARLAEALADVRAGDRVTLSCEDKDLDCTGKFLSLASKVSATHRCADISSDCYEYSMGDWFVTIVNEYPGTTRHTTITLASETIVVT